MNSYELPSLHDVYSLLDEDEKIKEINYMLQFVWRDLSSKFDIIGLYYSSAQGFDSKFTMACLQDTLYFFEAYSFHVLAIIGDGASWNHTVFKRLCGHRGKFGMIDCGTSESIHNVPASFTNPYTGARVWCIICPSYEVCKRIYPCKQCLYFFSLIYHSSRAWCQHSTTLVMAAQSTFLRIAPFFGWKQRWLYQD